jgi:hypothetical protein
MELKAGSWKLPVGPGRRDNKAIEKSLTKGTEGHGQGKV